jgi:hypothetical protein
MIISNKIHFQPFGKRLVLEYKLEGEPCGLNNSTELSDISSAPLNLKTKVAEVS